MKQEKFLSWNSPIHMTPYLPEQSPNWQEVCTELAIKAAKLQESLHPATQKALIPILALMNCYYSNLIEGHRTYPIEIDNAIRFASEKKSMKALVCEAIAHIETQSEISLFISDPDWNPVDPRTLMWIHADFIKRLPDDYLKVQDKTGKLNISLKPGELRDGAVVVGNHLAPDYKSIPSLLQKFYEIYSTNYLPSPQNLASIAAAHHKLVWIHPFFDGNGRVARLMTDAMLDKCNIGSNGLWRIARGFARTVNEYKTLLASADNTRQGDLDGRGNLSQKALNDWCFYVIKTAIDQVDFMRSLINPIGLNNRILKWAKDIFPNSRYERISLLLTMAIQNGSVSRTNASYLLGVTERQTRNIIDDLKKRGVINAAPRENITIAIPLSIAPHWFPGLFPLSEEEEILKTTFKQN